MLEQLFTKLPILASFMGGLITFLSPCILPLIPSYMSYISGSSLSDVKNYSKTNTLLNAILFILGFSIVFFLFGLAMVNIIDNVFNYSFVRYISGGIVIIFGLHFLGLFRINLLYNTKKLNLERFEKNKYLSFLSPFIFGLGFAAGCTPCTGPIISSISFLAASNQAIAIICLVFFILGLGIPFLLLALFLEKGLAFVRKIKKYMRVIEVVSGVFLIFIGVLIIFGQINFIVEFLEFS